MAHLHTQPGQHDATASAFIIRTDGPEPRLVLHWHKKLNAYLQFGGHVEHNEDPWEAITHEVAEESGYAMDQLQVLQPELRVTSLTGIKVHPQPIYIMTHPFPGMDHYHDDVAFAFVTDQEPRQAVGEGESPEIKLFTAEELRVLADEQIPPNVREVGLLILENYLSAWKPVSIF